jgi:stearoyl-CoA desaturase (delta-9 desaturase)
MHASQSSHGTKLIATDRVFPNETTSAVDGVIRIKWGKIIWLLGNGVGGILELLWYTSIDTVLVFMVLTAVTICAGHSVGMHRLLIHRSFETKRGVEYILVWLGTLVGMAGPFGLIHAHDMRDWHQRQIICPPHPSHDAHFFKDAFWQMCCAFELKNPPKFVIEPHIHTNPVYRIIERTWMAQQIPLALILYIFGGWAWVLWGCCLRIIVSVVGHWMVGHFAHHKGEQDWLIEGLPVQGYNLPKLGLITFGESWHGNHHAFPHSAKLGLDQNQSDLGYVFITFLKTLGLAWGIKFPSSEPNRTGLVRIHKSDGLEADEMNSFNYEESQTTKD